ncbi:sulfite exporter TauE/SafE family protein [Caproicibacter sp.]|uniref:sulfite exporter TauE/SafE family protein n=1 Tax=Caproicibacter sp. TaxID=2814884 RepID=UPI00398A3F48
MTLLHLIAIVCPLVFLASLVDSIAGGGGLISLPAYYLTGLPAHFCLGSNKFSSCTGTLFSTGRFLRSGNFHLRTAAVAAAAALGGSFLGARLTLFLDDHALRIAMLILLPAAAVFIFWRGRQRSDSNTFDQIPRRRAILLSAVIGLVIGAYDGFFGPGTGTFLILAFTTILGFDMKTACGNTKVVNLASNLAALATFIAAGTIQYNLAVPAAACSIAGHWIGSGLAIKKGAKFIRPVMVLVLILLFSKLVFDMFA